MATPARAPRDLPELLRRLSAAGQLIEVDAQVDADLEAAEVHRRVIAAGGPAVLFRNVRDRDFPLVTNLFGTPERVAMAFGDEPGRLIAAAARLPEELMPPTPGKLWEQRGLFAKLARVGLRRTGERRRMSITQRPPKLTRLPALRTWSRDGGPFLTLPLVYTQHPVTGGSNLGMYRVQIFDDTTTGLHMQIGKGGGFHLAEAARLGQELPVNIHLGGPPASILGAIAPLPENVPELLLSSLALGTRLDMANNPAGPLPVIGRSEFCLVGRVRPGEVRPEGPFGDHYGYYSETHDYPVFHCDALLAAPDAIFPATVVGKPRQEDFYLGDFLQDLLAPLFPVVMPGVRDLWSFGETGYHSLSAAVVQERYRREAMASAFRILGEGQLSLTKFLLVLDQPPGSTGRLTDFSAVLTHVLERADFRTDLFLMPNLSMDTLDYAGPQVNEGSKGVLLGLGEKRRELPREFSGTPSRAVTDVRVFCPGCLVVQGAGHGAEPDLPGRIAADPAFADWPFVVLTDDAQRAAKSDMNFLWTTFTRFDPASDLTAASVDLVKNHAAFTPPVVLDARMKAWYPEELYCDERTAELVDRRWNEYFPAGTVAMGDSDRGHLD
ncbi:MAG: UbiD family decarboxylase [Planctomycetota bacterium]|nr:UbiD family decarboxylase [Planctomycetota bacterium]